MNVQPALNLQAGLLAAVQRRRRVWQKIVSVLACIVVFCTTYALILPAITMENPVFCGLEEHEHTEECYEQITAGFSEMICSAEELDIHEHTDACFDEAGNILCVMVDFVLHLHDDLCYDADGELICPLPETEEHEHTDECFAVSEEEPVGSSVPAEEELSAHIHSEACFAVGQGTLLCDLPAEGHRHGDGCYEIMLICTLDGDEEHTHGEECSGPVLVCGEDETDVHEHTEECYEWNEVLICGEGSVESSSEETEGESLLTEDPLSAEEEPALEEPELVCDLKEIRWHEHGSSCYADGVLVCKEIEVRRHQHDENCFEIFGTEGSSELTCTDTSEEHEHSALCFGNRELICEQEEHVHDESCMYDPDADVETQEEWTAAFAGASLTGNWAEDVLLIAKSQLGYAESTENLLLSDDGITLGGYTRYGDWYGEPYADWNTLFAAFCLHYAQTDFPFDPDAAEWADLLNEDGLWFAPEDHIPLPGELIFLDMDEDGTADRTGIVSRLEDGAVYVIEGDLDGIVAESAYQETAAVIAGYAGMPRLTEEQLAAVEDVITMIDEMPSADDIDARLAEYEDAEDYEGEEAYYTEIVEQVAWVYSKYNLLTEEQKALITNADKLLELEYIWSQAVLIEEIPYTAPTAIEAASTRDFIELNLYDYNGKINTNYDSDKDWPGFQWNGGAYYNSSYSRRNIDYIDFGNSMITDRDYTGSGNGKASSAWNIGRKGGAINDIIEYPDGDWANKPVGMSNGTDVLKRTLGSDGYPAVLNAGSMKEYFTSSSFASKKNTQSIDGLFQHDPVTGEYHYNSRLNHAQYSSNQFTLYDEIITPNFITYPFGNFLPFNTITNKSTATQVGSIGKGKMDDYVQGVINDLVAGDEDATEQQLIDMLAMYRTNLQNTSTSGGTAWTTWSAKDAIYDYIGNGPTDDTGPITDALLNRMYNIDWDVDTNFFFGMEMKMTFMQPKGGMTGNDTNRDGESDYPMVFYFTGDDDVWVYIDEVLFLDLSGIHRHVGGEIDFVNGKVHYYALDPQIGDVSSTPYATYTFEELLTEAGKSTEVLNSKGTFKDYTTHKFNFYYMERGSGSSVCRINFNFPLLKQNAISVQKEVSADTNIMGDPDYSFQIMKATSSGAKTNELFIGANTDYTVYDLNNKQIGTGTTDENGVFTLKAGQRAEFEGIEENSGKYYVRELLDGTVLEQYGNITVSGESTTQSNNVIVGSDSFTGMDSPVKDMSNGTTAFRFINDVDEKKLGTLSISKELTEFPRTRAIKQFDIEVTLDGEKIPVGMNYQVNGQTRTVTSPGIVTIAAGETAVIGNILAGTTFRVQETSGSAKGYVVTYKADNYTVTVADNAASGVIKTDANVQLVVTNSEQGASVTIPVSKQLSNFMGDVPRTYTFRVQQVAGETDLTPVPNGLDILLEITVDSTEPVQTALDIAYAYADVMEKFDDENSVTFFYLITEVVDETDYATVYDTSQYLAAVKLTGTDERTLTPAGPSIVKLGETNIPAEAAAFVNTLTTYTLPETGGAGTTRYALGGLTLIFGAVFLLYKQRKHGKEALK